MRLKPLLLLPAAACAVLLVGCSSDDTDTAATGVTAISAEASAPSAGDVVPASNCPTQAPAEGTEPEWTVEGTTGSVSIVGQTDTTAPLITVDKPFAVDETEVKTLSEGTGPEVTDSSTITVCYVGVDGRDGATFDSAHQRGAPEQFPAGGVIPGFRQALVGQKVGSTVAVVIPSKDGYPQGTPDGSIKAGDTIVFALKILAAN